MTKKKLSRRKRLKKMAKITKIIERHNKKCYEPLGQLSNIIVETGLDRIYSLAKDEKS